MNALKKNLIQQAMERYEHIAPCTTLPSLEDSFTIENDKLVFWFNTDDHSTHVVTAQLSA
jgi:hypothetical protein